MVGIKVDIPQKSNIDNYQKLSFFKGVTFSKASFWVSMLVFGSVTRCWLVDKGQLGTLILGHLWHVLPIPDDVSGSKSSQKGVGSSGFRVSRKTHM